MGRRAVVLLILSLTAIGLLASCSSPPEGSPEWHLARAYDFAERGHFLEAIEEYSTVLEAHYPNRAEAYINRAAAQNSLQEYDAAIADSTRAISLDPSLVLAYLNRAYAFNEKSQYEAAIEDSDKAIELDRTIAEAYVLRAQAYNGLGTWNLAVADCNRALDLDAELVVAYYRRAQGFKGLGETERAIEDFEKFITLTDNPLMSNTAVYELEQLK